MSESESHQPIHESEALTFAGGPAMAVPTIDRVVSLIPGFVCFFNHLTYSNDDTNKSVALHLGYSSEEIRPLGGGMFMRLVHEGELRRLGAHMLKTAQPSDGESAVVEYRVERKEGNKRWLRSVERVFGRDPDGKVLRHIGCASDFTAEKEAQLALTRLNAALEEKVEERTRDLAELNVGLRERVSQRPRELEEAVEELEQLTFIATHDLKVPANNISRLAQMLGVDVIDIAPEQELVGWVHTIAEQLHQKIQGFVFVAQLRLSSEFSCQRLNLGAQVRSSIKEFESGMQGASLPAICDILDDLEVEFPKFELGCILTSLLDNSVKYTALRPLQITMRARCEEGHAVLTVADSGSGIGGARESAKVFGLFQRAHKTPAGSGIFLYCDQRMLQRRGATSQSVVRAVSGRSLKLAFQGAKKKMMQIKRILLVDDDVVTNMLHSRVIARSGRAQSIEVATDGQEALDILNADIAAGRPLPELIFLDINMPGMGGFEFLEEYAMLDIASEEQLIIVMLSTTLLPADHRRVEADPHVHSFCDKPLRLEDLIEVIEAFQSKVADGRSAA